MRATLETPVLTPSGGFIAGTLVHTTSGLIPIEQVRVGDWVLSRQDGESDAAPSCKQVVNARLFDDKEIILVRCYKPDGTVEQFGATGDHPFRVLDAGWTGAGQLGSGTCLELHDRSTAITLCASPLMRSAEPGLGWATAAWGVESNDGAGYWVDLRNRSIAVGSEEVFNWDVLDNENADPHFTAQVFNLEIDGFNSYCVGASGVWVRSAGGVDIGVP